MKISPLIIVLAAGLIAPCAAYAVKTAKADPKHDRHTPVEVTSDTLEVFQKENRAVFTGHVVAIQGEIRLKSDVMTVHYRKQAEPGEPKDKTKSATPGDVQDSAIEKIDADGNVFLSTPQETASGATGTYEPQKHEIHLHDHVVLTRGKNVLKGEHLVYNLDSGQSELIAGNGKPAEGKTSGRVHALFVPGGDETKKDKQK
jgi:lipopolysaccharide export system protein LptA